MRGTGILLIDGWNKDGWWVLHSHGSASKGPKVLVWSSPRISNGEGKQQPQCEKSSGVAGSLGRGRLQGKSHGTFRG